MRRNDESLRSIAVVNRLPASVRPEESDRFPDDLRGATIVQIGAPADHELLEGGGLVIDYQPPGSKSVRRLVLGLNDLGAWVEYHGPAE